MGYYQQQVQRLVREGQLDLYLIFSVPRAASTLLEASFSMNPKITGQCHEASDNLRGGRGDVDAMYKSIYLNADGDVLSNNRHSRHAIVVKEMTHRIGAGDTFQDLLLLSSSPPLFLIRDPLLSMESRMKKVLKGLSMRHEEALTSWLSIDSGNNGANSQTTKDNLDEQRHMLDSFAQANNVGDWKTLLERSISMRDYRSVGKVLQSDKVFALSRSGWDDMEQQIRYMKQNGKDYTVVDSTELRATPNTILPTLCQKWGLSFDPAMVKWGTKIEGFQLGQDLPHQQIWYDKVLASMNIQPPKEIPPVLDAFPEHIAQYLRFSALPSYMKISRDQNRITTEGVLEKSIIVDSDSYTYRRLLDIRGFSPIYHRFPITLPLGGIDPIFAVGTDPSLLDDAHFRRVNHAYHSALGFDRHSQIEGDSLRRRR